MSSQPAAKTWEPPKPVHEQSLFSISWPVMLTTAVGISGPILDSWFLSRISDEAAAGVGATLPVFVLLQTILNALGQAGAGIAGQFYGARRQRLANATFALMFTLLTCGGLILGSLLSWATPWVVMALGLKGPIAEHSSIFLHTIGPGFASRALLSALTYFLATRGLTRWNLWSSLGIVGLNAIFNTLFVAGVFGLPRLGVPGVAIATVLSWTIVGLATLGVVVRRLNFRPSWAILVLGYRRIFRDLARIGLPSAVEPISYQLFQVALASQIVRLGAIALTARVYAANVANLPALFSMGLGFGAQILVAHLVGAGDHRTADRRLRVALAWGMSLAFVASVSTAIVGAKMIGLFTTDARIVTLGATLLWIDVCVQPAKAANIAITFSLRAAGDSRFPAIVGTSLMWTVGLGAALTLAFGARLGVIGIWMGMAVDEATRAIVNWMRWRGGVWKTKGVVTSRTPSAVTSAPVAPEA